MAPMFYQQFLNGFSGQVMYDGFYYALFSVNNTTLALGFMMVFDTDVDYNLALYDQEKLPKNKLRSLTYDPTKIARWDLKYASRLDYMEARGISTNEDGSTNNLAEYFWYCRDCVSSKMKHIFAFYYFWGFFGGGIVYLISFISLNNIFDSEGQTINYWSTGMSIFTTCVLVYHVQTLLEYRCYNFPAVLTWIISLMMFMPLTVMVSDAQVH
jgi:hypothetical protein